MFKDKEIKKTNGTFVHLEKPEFGIIIQNEQIVNPEAWEIYKERQRQNKYVPSSADIEEARARNAQLINHEDNKMTELRLKKLENGMDNIASLLTKLVEQNGDNQKTSEPSS